MAERVVYFEYGSDIFAFNRPNDPGERIVVGRQVTDLSEQAWALHQGLQTLRSEEAALSQGEDGLTLVLSNLAVAPGPYVGDSFQRPPEEL